MAGRFVDGWTLQDKRLANSVHMIEILVLRDVHTYVGRITDALGQQRSETLKFSCSVRESVPCFQVDTGGSTLSLIAFFICCK